MRGRRRAFLADTAVWDVFIRDPPLETGAPAPEVGTYRWVDGFAELIVAINCKSNAQGAPVNVASGSLDLDVDP
jgi:hypothetical protein